MLEHFDTEPKVPGFVRTVLTKAAEGIAERAEKEELKDGTRLDRSMIAVVAVQAVNDVIAYFRNKKMYSASNWLVAGAVAFIFAIVLDPSKFFEIYGVIQTKVAFVFFLASIFYGVRNSWAESVNNALEESDMLKTLFEKMVEIEEANTPQKREEEKKDKKSIERLSAEAFVRIALRNLVGTKNFWIQMCTFGFGLSIFLVLFLFK